MSIATDAAAILREAADLIEGARAEEYGDYLDNLKMMSHSSGTTVLQAGAVMEGVKRARLANNPAHHDSIVDLVAYTAMNCVVRKQLQPYTSTQLELPNV